MKNQIIIHAAANQTRVALIENGELAQLFIESPENQRTVGNIYLAEVHKVMAGIRAAFINMGTQKDAFLHFSDTGEHLENYLIMLNGKDALPDRSKQEEKAKQIKNTGNGSVTEEQNRMGALLAPKQKVLVQIVKEPIGSKGPRVSTNITVAGRFLVLIPMGEYVAVSKRIRSHKERRRLRSCISSVLPEGFGVIVRTLADGQTEEALHEDLKDVLDKWNAILEKLKEAKPPALLHQDMDMTESLVRDLFAKDYSRILIDDAKIFRSIKSYISRVAPNMVPNIELYKGSEHIFDYMKISRDVDSVFSPRVKMPSGGYLIFEQTEAMYVVDVNSGRYAAKREQEENSLKTNLESAREIAKQLRLRDIGGIIVVDFIDLREDSNRKKVYDELRREFRKDRAKTNVLPMSDFGLVQITRQRIRPSVVKSVSKVCPMCGGSGNIVSQNTVVADIEGWLTKFKYNYKGHYSLDLHLNPYLKSMIQKGWFSQRIKWLFSYRLNINILGDETLSMNDYKFMLPNSEIDITDTVLNDQPLEKAITETDLRIDDSRGEKKNDDPGLDYFQKDQKKAKPSGQGSGRQGQRSTGSTKPGSQKGKPPSSRQSDKKKQARQEQSGKDPVGPKGKQKPASDSVKSKATDSKPADSKEKKEPQTGKQTGKKTDVPQSAPKRSGSKAKYYKSSRDDSGQETASEKPAKQSGAPAEDKGQKEQPSKDQDDTAGLPSAVEVARQHRLEKEKEEAAKKEGETGGDKDSAGSKDSGEKKTSEQNQDKQETENQTAPNESEKSTK
ncbi:Rne/Rng family ribonuclease [Natronogracilivirga saccharolytica]|uniref:Rne/Rng family ribonuclease n=1 Tax=Natronogracilivirga saccharolytica TaxID=2812953 RepID=A0A8J7RTG1_9BACT|nr:Rne/Rng family ribonuclease [Natronogracilivirga saccharolytica]MBP3192657.1 Rne/Rng family ribonuclease [Natronogracilivirga saccharolytica]